MTGPRRGHACPAQPPASSACPPTSCTTPASPGGDPRRGATTRPPATPGTTNRSSQRQATRQGVSLALQEDKITDIQTPLLDRGARDTPTLPRYGHLGRAEGEGAFCRVQRRACWGALRADRYCARALRWLAAGCSGSLPGLDTGPGASGAAACSGEADAASSPGRLAYGRQRELAQPVQQAFHDRKVHAADHVGVHGGEGAERAVGEDQPG